MTDTLKDIVYVVDSGRVKENRFDEVKQMPALVECWASHAASKQRRGRAGRVRPGIAYHMYSSNTFNTMNEYQRPEMQRVGLDDLILQILMLDLGEPTSFLLKAIDPPSVLMLKNSLKLLEGIGAVDVNWSEEKSEAFLPNSEEIGLSSALTALGFHLATLPVQPKVRLIT